MSDKDAENNVTLKCKSLFYESSGNIVVLPEGKLAVVQGIDDCIIVETEKALLICKKDEEQRIRQFVNDTKVQVGDDFV